MYFTIRHSLILIPTLIGLLAASASFAGSDKEITVFDEQCLQNIVRTCAEDIQLGKPATRRWSMTDIKGKSDPMNMTPPLPEDAAEWKTRWNAAICPPGYNKSGLNKGVVDCHPTAETIQTAYQYCYYKARAGQSDSSACVRVLRPEIIAESSSKDMRLLLNQFCKTYAEKKEKCDEVLPPAVEKK